MRRAGQGGLVYSTDSGRMCPACRQPQTACTCEQQRAPAGDGAIRVSRDSKGRGGKTVTVVRGLALDETARIALGKRLRSACGSGGTVKDGCIEIQGDKREEMKRILTEAGFKPVFAGG